MKVKPILAAGILMLVGAGVLAVLYFVIYSPKNLDPRSDAQKPLNVIEDSPQISAVGNIVSNKIYLKVNEDFSLKTTGEKPQTNSAAMNQILDNYEVKSMQPVVLPGPKSNKDHEIFKWYLAETDDEEMDIPAKYYDDTNLLDDSKLKNEKDTNVVKAAETLESLFTDINSLSNVEAVELVQEDIPTMIPNDSMFQRKGSFTQDPSDPAFQDMWWVSKIGLDKAWDYLEPGEEGITEKKDTADSGDIVVAVVDTGVDYNHPDLRENIWKNTDEIAGNNIDDDNNGYIDDYIGWDFFDNDNNPKDENGSFGGHGTFTASIVGAVVDNDPNGNPEDGKGMTGVAKNVKIMPIRKFGTGAGNNTECMSSTVCSLVYAADNGADISSNSYHGGGRLVADAIDYGNQKGMLSVFSSGNDGLNSLLTSHASEAAMTIGATRANDNVAPWSNWGENIDVVAPGSLIMSLKGADTNWCTPDITKFGNYCRSSGTSFSTPMVAGLAALIKSYVPDLTPQQIRQVIRLSADDVDETGHDVHAGYGRIDAANAMLLASNYPDFVPLGLNVTSPRSDEEVQGKSVQIKWSLMDQVNGETQSIPNASISRIKVLLGKGVEPSNWITIYNYKAGKSAVPSRYVFDTTAIEDGLYIFKVEITDKDGHTYVAASYNVEVANIDTDVRMYKTYLNDKQYPVTGTVKTNTADTTLKRYTIQYAQTGTSNWSNVGVNLVNKGTRPVENNTLGTIDTRRLTAGAYDIKVSASLVSGGFEEYVTTIGVVDSVVSSCPAACGEDLGFSSESRGDGKYNVKLSWPLADPTLLMYFIHRCVDEVGAFKPCTIRDYDPINQFYAQVPMVRKFFVDFNGGDGYEEGTKVRYELRSLIAGPCPVEQCQELEYTVSPSVEPAIDPKK